MPPQDEKIVDNYLEFLKWKEFNNTQDNFLPSRPIEDVLEDIKTSDVFRILKTLPKGGNMHLHQSKQCLTFLSIFCEIRLLSFCLSWMYFFQWTNQTLTIMKKHLKLPYFFFYHHVHADVCIVFILCSYCST